MYRATGKKRNMQPIFKNENGFSLSREKLDTIGWIIGKEVGGMHCAHYAVASAALEPPASGWQAFEGADPPPSIFVKRSGGGSTALAAAELPSSSDSAQRQQQHHHHPPSQQQKPHPPPPKRQASMGATMTNLSVDAENSRQRDKLYQRIVITEADYERYLDKILQFVVEPMRVARTAPAGFNDELVPRFMAVMDSSAKILAYIRKREETRPSQLISGVFIENVATLKSYLGYYKQYPRLLAAARKCLGDMRTLAADASFVGATLPVILFRPVLRLFEYDFCFVCLAARCRATELVCCRLCNVPWY